MLKWLYISILLSSHVSFGQRLIVLEDTRLPGPDSVLVITPKQYHNDKPYPLVFLLHGWSGNYRQWNHITNLQTEASKHQFIIVCPDGFYDSWYINSPTVEKSQFRSFFFEKLLTSIISSFNIDTTNIFITGLSMGGFGAVSLFLYKPSVFKAAGSTSGILDISQFHNKFGMERVLGGFAEHAESYRALSPINQLESSSLIGKTLIIDCGTEDFAYRANQAFYDRCKALKINAIWVSQPGTHGSDYWKKSIGQQLLLFARLVRQ